MDETILKTIQGVVGGIPFRPQLFTNKNCSISMKRKPDILTV